MLFRSITGGAVALAFLLFPEPSGLAAAGRAGTWHTYTSKREIRGIASGEGVLWAATGGGLYSYRLSDGVTAEFTASEGLRTIDLTAVAWDGRGTLWTGASNGFLHGYTPASGEWEYVGDLSILQAPKKRIISLVPRGDTLFILSEVGVSIFSLSRREFGDTYSRFGLPPLELAGQATDLQVFRETLWVSTLAGIASTPMRNTNPSAPDSWRLHTAADGLPSSAVKALIVAGGDILAATQLGIARYRSGAWQAVPATRNMDIAAFGERQAGCETCAFHFISSNRLWTLSGADSVSLVAQFSDALTAVAGGAAAGTQSNGMFVLVNGEWSAATPPGPLFNRFVGLTVDTRGVLWSGSGTASSDGFVQFDGRAWRSYRPANDTILGPATEGGGAAYQVDLGPNDTKWVSLYGRGVAVLDAGGEIRRVFNTTNGLSNTRNEPNNRTFVVGAGVVADESGNVWINVRSPVDRRLLAVYSPPSGTFRYVLYPRLNPPILIDMVMDFNGAMWFRSFSDVGNASPGLVFYDPFRQAQGRLDDSTGWGILTQFDGLANNEVSAVAVDNEGKLWVGAPEGGLSFIKDPLTGRNGVLSYPAPDSEFRIWLEDQKINDILVDPLNMKWIATDNGVFVLSEDGSELVGRYTVASTNAKIPDNRILSLAMDRSTGVVYIGTEKGVASLTTAAITPLRVFEELSLSPNPFILPSGVPLLVDGLVEASILKVLSIDGNLVREIQTPGGRVGTWDGRDDEGRFVSSGVYIIVAHSKDGSKVATAKVAVVRK